MEDKKLKNGIEELRKVTMTTDEKNRIFDYVTSSPFTKTNAVRSPWFTFSFVANIHKSRLAYYIIVPLIIVITGGGAVFASESSLPDSIFYPIKVNIVEPIHEALTFKPEAKANYESSLATKRMVEAETLADQGKLDKGQEDKLNTLLVKHSKKLNDAIDKINQDNQSGQADEIVTSFKAKMNAHANVLDIITTQESIEKKGLLSNTEDDKQISQSARMNANNVGNRFNNKDKIKKEDRSSEYKKRKDNIKFIINNTTADINNDTAQNGNDRQAIIDNTHNTLDNAQQLLDEADEKERGGNLDDAYKTLLDSESTAKEAHIFFNAGLQFKGRNHSQKKDN